MFKLVPEEDLRDKHCGLVLMNQKLERGVNHANVDEDTDSGGSEAFYKYMEEMDLNNDGIVSKEEFLKFLDKEFGGDGKMGKGQR